MSERERFGELEEAVGALLDEVKRLRKRSRAAEARLEETETLLSGFKTGNQDPARLSRRLSELEQENRTLKERIHEGREGVERLLGRIRFLEEQR